MNLDVSLVRPCFLNVNSCLLRGVAKRLTSALTTFRLNRYFHNKGWDLDQEELIALVHLGVDHPRKRTRNLAHSVIKKAVRKGHGNWQLASTKE